MKKEFKMQGRVTMDRNDLTQAVKEWLVSNEGLNTQKFKWLEDGSAVIEVEKTETKKPLLIKHKIVNKGFFPAVREYLASELRVNSNVKVDDLWKLVKVEFPGMDEKKLNIYLHDKRQLPNIDYDATNKVIYPRVKTRLAVSK